MNFTRREILLGVPVALVAIRRSPQSPGGLEGGLDAERDASALSRPAIEGLFNTPVVSFHLDHPYLDLTGLQQPYIPPIGMRSAAPLAALSEEQLLSRFYGFI